MKHVTRLAQFEGRWRLERLIKDRRNETDGRLTGEARFTRTAEDAFHYEEEGMLDYGNATPMAATRRYLWRAGEEGIEVLFEDGRPFHQIALDRLMPDDNHHCDPDVYHVSYDFRDWPKWRSIWRVVGPSKDYRMMSDYSRA